jgi:Na+-transporting NADH:ubiquinone oxidoreductase subunit C
MVRSVVFMVVVCAVCTAIPAIVRVATAHRVAANERMATYTSVLSVLNLPVDPKDPGAVEHTFRACVREETIGGRTYWYGLKEPAIGVVAFPVQGPGFWGPIHGIAAVAESEFAVVGLSFTRHEETPGLGGRIDEPWFTAQFRGVRLDPFSPTPLVRLVPQGGRVRPNDVDAITGATETSRKIQSLFDADMRQALLVLKDSGQ